MLTNAGLAISIENLNGIPNTQNPQADKQALTAKQNKVSIASIFVVLPAEMTFLTVLRSYPMVYICPSGCSLHGGGWLLATEHCGVLTR
jgi:hypothetical protein